MTHNKSVISAIRARFERNRLGELLVQRGKLTPAQLHTALNAQKNSDKTLGHIIRDLGFVSKSQIRTTLFEQTAYRAIAAVFTLFIGISSFASGGMAKTQNLNNIKPQYGENAMVYKAAYGGSRHQLNANPTARPSNKLFGTKEIASQDISAFKKWTDILNRLDRVSFNNAHTEAFRDLSISEKVSSVNDYVNKVRYIEDKDNFGKSDYWATPSEFFARGGDCEDFAIAKYAMLKELGIPENQMRLAIVQDKIKNIPHAVLIVYTDNGPMLLDNQIKTTSKVASVQRYKPIYSINSNGWWRHIT